MTWNLRRMVNPDRPTESSRRVGFWFLAAHLLTDWAIALSNAALGLAILWCARHRHHLDWRWPRSGVLLLPLGFYAVFYAVSVLASLEPATSAIHIKSLIGLTTLPLTILLVRGRKEVRRLFDLLLLLMVALAFYGIGQYLLTDYGPLDNRIPGPYSHYMTFSGVLLLGFFLLLGRMGSGDGWKRLHHWLALVILGTTLLLTLTRGAWVAALAAFTIVLVLRARRFLPVYLAALALVGVLIAGFGSETLRERIYSITDPRNESNYDRLSMLQAGFFMISERPLFGIGPGMVAHRYPIYRHPTAPHTRVKHLHNTFLQIAAENGLLSLGAYLWLMIAGLRVAYLGYRREGPNGGEADLYLGVMLALVGFNLAGLFEANWRDSEIQRLVLFLLAVPLCFSPTNPARDENFCRRG